MKIFEDAIGLEGFAAVAVASDALASDEVFAADPAALDDALAGRFQGGVDVLGARIRLGQ